MAKAIPGPGMAETVRRLYPLPFRALPAFVLDMTERYGDIVAFAIPGRRFVMLNHPEQIKDVLVTQQHAFTKSEGGRTLKMLLGDGLLTSEDPLHRQMRRIVQPGFHKERIVAYAQTMRKIADEWVSARRDGERIEMASAMSELTLRIASVTLFGADAGAQAHAVRDALHETMQAYTLAIGPFGSLQRRLRFLPAVRRFEAARARLDRVIYGLIAERRATRSAHDDALSLLLTAEDVESGYRLSDEQVRDEAMTLFLAGHETTANALVWTWYLLAEHPDVDARMHAEIAAAHPHEDPIAYVAQFDYTRRVLREAMRLYPPAWIIGREAQRDVMLPGGYAIARSTTVFVSQLALHRRATFFPDPLRFDPDRWVRDEIPAFAYVPFGGGARRCIGEEFAWMEGTLLLAALARAFRFDRIERAPVATEALVTLRPKGPVWMHVIAR